MFEIVNWLLLNTHLLPFIVLIFGGGVILVGLGFSFALRTGIWITTPFDIKKLTPLQGKIFHYAVLCIIVGFFGLMYLSSKFGYFYYDNAMPVWTK